MLQHCLRTGIVLGCLMTGGLLAGCGFMGSSDTADTPPATQVSAPGDTVAATGAAAAGGANLFNPWMQEKLPNTRELSDAGQAMLPQMGGSAQRIEKEAAYRDHWREEIYPVVFGDKKAPHELMVLLDFANPASAALWDRVVEASRSLNPSQTKIVVFANSRENYGTDLMGLAIWISYERKGQAMAYLTYALDRWNEVKAGQKKTRGKAIPFTNEYDATVQSTDFPIHYAYLQKLNPPVPASREMDVTSYCYDAGSVNMYQAVQLTRYYKLSGLPALIADGRVIPASSSASAIVSALR